LSLLLGGGLLLAAGCRRFDPCPPRMRYAADKSTAGESIWCKSPDGKAAQWVELKEGRERQICKYVEGQPDGPFRAFHPGGARWIEGRFQGGYKHGHWSQWDKGGYLVAEGDYRQGRLVEGAPVAMAARCEQMKP
jgi:hypothetical protein